MEYFHFTKWIGIYKTRGYCGRTYQDGFGKIPSLIAALNEECFTMSNKDNEARFIWVKQRLEIRRCVFLFNEQNCCLDISFLLIVGV